MAGTSAIAAGDSLRPQVEEDIARLTRHARCSLWHGTVLGLAGWDTPDGLIHDKARFLWHCVIHDVDGARQVIDPPQEPGESFDHAWGRSRLPDDDERMWTTAAMALQRGDRGYAQEFRCRDRHGKIQWLYESVTLRPHGPGKWQVFGVVVNITERKVVEEQLQQAKFAAEQARAEAEAANRAKDQFLAVLSHELRTPLTPVLLAASMLERDDRLPGDVILDLSAMRRHVELEARLIDDLLDVTRIARGKMQFEMQWTDLHTIIQSAADICSQGEGARIRLELDARRSRVWGDPARLQQVLWNLLNNARKFTPASGCITVTSADADIGRIRVEVRDTGAGIEPEFLPRVFEAFEQGQAGANGRHGGLGLGLAISRSIANAHGGTLSATSAGHGQGATFVLELTSAQMQVLSPGEQLAQRSACGERDRVPHALSILVVEDHAATLALITRLMQSLGHKVCPAATAGEAIHAAEVDRFDVVLSDLGLPDQSGHELMRQLKQQYGLRGIALSGYGRDEDKQESMDAGFVEHLTKPIDIDHLAAALQRVTNR